MEEKLTLGGSNSKNESMFDNVSPDQNKIVQIMDMGFERDLAASALVATNNSGVQEAVNWILAGGTVNPSVTQQKQQQKNEQQQQFTSSTNRNTNNNNNNNENQNQFVSEEKDPTLNPDVDVLRNTGKYSNSLRGFSRAERLEFEKKQREKYAEEKRRERQQKQAQLKAIRKQLEAEREARKQKKPSASSSSNSNSNSSSSTQSSHKSASSSSKPNLSKGECLLQLRLPDGRAKKKKFSALDTIRTVYQFLESECGQTPGTFLLIINIPRQEFGSDRFDETLHDAGLCPRAQMIVEQTENKGVVTRGEGHFQPATTYPAPGPGLGAGAGPGFAPGGGMMGGQPVSGSRPPAYKGDDSDIDSSDDENAPQDNDNNDNDDSDDDMDDDIGRGGMYGGGRHFPGAGHTLGN